ncbi:hypothetical protein DSO57_1033807 [Entomophthora muscae]|uniref:Uncharacterized protein n=1 Tax=Entomophthora muscae TaxID=34485 RepID=A0ACC2SCP7_9FUNG|nr:hypothetical protein DSO57_1033807 [Entomophthora muscae]
MEIVDSLPHFILDETLSYIEATELKRFRLLNKRWNIKLSPIFTRFLGSYDIQASRCEILRFFSSFGKNLTSLNFASFETDLIDKELIKAITTSCRHIKSLELKVPEESSLHSEFILEVERTQSCFKHLSLLGPFDEAFLISVSPVLKKLESINLNPYYRAFRKLEPLVNFLTFSKLKIFTLKGFLYPEKHILDVLQKKFSTLEYLYFKDETFHANALKFVCVNPKTCHIKEIGISYLDERIRVKMEFHNVLVPTSHKLLIGSIAEQINRVESYFHYLQGFSDLSNIFPNLKAIDLCLGEYQSRDPSLLFFQLTKVEKIYLNMDFRITLCLPDKLFNAKVLSLQISQPLLGSYLCWVAKCFPFLESFYVYTRLSPASPNLRFKSLVKFYSTTVQSLEFLFALIATSPNLKYICIPDKAIHLKALTAKFPAIRVLNWNP